MKVLKTILLILNNYFVNISYKMDHYHYKVPGWFSFPTLYTGMVSIHSSGSHFVEVGCWMGASASYMGVEIANSGKDIKFDCVDEWSGYVADGLFMKQLPDNPGDFVYNLFLENTTPVRQYANPIRSTSIEAAAKYADKSLDFVFIDANHVFEAVIQDLVAWFPKIKVGGYIGGHDVKDDSVRRAIDQYFGANNYIFDYRENSWLHHKSS